MPPATPCRTGGSITPNIDELITEMEKAAVRKHTWMSAGRDGIEQQDDLSNVVTKNDLKQALEAIRKDIQALAEKARMKVGFDYWQVISHYSDQTRALADALRAHGDDVYVISAIG